MVVSELGCEKPSVGVRWANSSVSSKWIKKHIVGPPIPVSDTYVFVSATAMWVWLEGRTVYVLGMAECSPMYGLEHENLREPPT